MEYKWTKNEIKKTTRSIVHVTTSNKKDHSTKSNSQENQRVFNDKNVKVWERHTSKYKNIDIRKDINMRNSEI